MCKTMEHLKMREYENRKLCYVVHDFHLEMFYGQAALEAQRLQRFHAERCQECMDAERTRQQRTAPVGY